MTQHKIWMVSSIALAMTGLSAGPGGADELAAAVEAVRVATDRFRDVDVALAEGYLRDVADHCVTAAGEGLPPELGGMGIHFIRPDLLGITATEPRVDGTGTHTDFDMPAILLYEPQADGTLALVGAENLVFKKAWEDAGNTEPPVFAGRTWDYMEDDPATEADEAHGFAPHYDQHVYFGIADAASAVLPFNASITCEYHRH
jgi:hypothetical protein